jgi:FkbM family methyltransferase
MSRSNHDRGLIFDGALALKKICGLVFSGAVFRGATARRALKKARWLSFKHLGIDQVVLPLRNGMKLCAKTSDDVIACDVYLDGQFCYGEFARAMSLLRRVRPWSYDKAVFLDIGANIGTHSLYALESKLFRRVISIEPEASNFSLLVQNLRINGFDASDAVNMALSDEVGTGFLSVSRDNYGDHRVVKDAREHSSIESIVLTDFPTLRKSLELPSDANMFFWVDTQGHEYQVLAGIGGDVLTQSVIVTEFWPSLLQKNGTLSRFLELAEGAMGRFAVLQDSSPVFADTGMLAPLCERLLRQPYPADQVDLLWIGNRLALDTEETVSAHPDMGHTIESALRT